MMNTSIRIRQYLETNNIATVEQLSRALDLTKADIHYHMRLLLKQGVLEIQPVPYQNGAGRPARQFTLVRPAPEPLSRLLISILTARVQETTGHQTPPDFLAEYLANGIFENGCGQVDDHLSPTIRLIRMLKALSVYGIHLRWLAHKDGPIIFVEQEYLSSLLKDPALVTRILESLIDMIKEKIA